jgi:hypothetical protein
MAGPLEVLPVDPAVATTLVEEEVDGGALGGCCQWVWQWPPLLLKKTLMVGPLGGVLLAGSIVATTVAKETSMADPLGGAFDGSDTSHHHCCGRRRWQAPRWVLLMGPAAAATVVEEDVDGGTWPLLRGPDPTLCLDVYWFLLVSSHIAIITPVIF